MNPTESLRAEHRLIHRVVLAVEPLAAPLRSGAPVPVNLLELVLDFLATYADGYHHRREEEILIPHLLAHGLAPTSGPIGLVMQEHKMARARIAVMRAALPLAAQGDHEARERLVKALEMYTMLLRNHIGMEDLAFYRQAEHLLPPEEQAQLSEDLAINIRPEFTGQYEASAARIEREAGQFLAEQERQVK